MSAKNITYDQADRDLAMASERPLVTIDVNGTFATAGHFRDTPRITFQGCLSSEQAERVLALLRDIARECMAADNDLVPPAKD